MLLSNLSLNSVEELKISNTLMAAPTIEGARELEKRYGLDRCLNISIISFLPVVYPPIAPPRAFPRVPVIMSTLSITP